MINGEASRAELNNYLNEKLTEITNRKEKKELYKQIYSKFNIPIEVTTDYFTFKRDIAEASTFEVFAFLYFIKRNRLGLYFTDNEIEVLSSEKADEKTITFPLTFKDIVQISEDQWIGRTSFQELMAMKDARLINYDENEQRTFRHIKSGDTEILRVYINKKSVQEIKEAFKNGRYIPDDITLNIPQGSEFSFSNNTLKIYSLVNDKFNIIDGYHRWLGMAEIYNFDKDFDYPMEIRFVNYSVEKANQFIFQKDQKTQMRKTDSASYNQYNVANRVVKRLNEDPLSNFQGMIARNDGLIKEADFAAIIDSFYVRKNEIENETSAVMAIKGDIQKKFNSLSESNPTYLNKKYTIKDLIIMMYVFTLPEIKVSEYDELINYLSARKIEKRYFTFNRGYVRRKAINELNNAMEEWRQYHVQ